MLVDGRAERGRVLLGHGAGAGMDSDFMSAVAAGLAGLGLEVIRFEYPYMQKIRLDGKRRPPDRMPRLIDYLSELVTRYKDDVPLYLAGKSMGGRVASMLLEQSSARAGFVFGYPFHARGKTVLRTGHLQELTKPLHVFQGCRDPMGTRTEVEGYALPEAVRMYWLEDGNHDLQPRKASGFTQAAHLERCLQLIKENLL